LSCLYSAGITCFGTSSSDSRSSAAHSLLSSTVFISEHVVTGSGRSSCGGRWSLGCHIAGSADVAAPHTVPLQIIFVDVIGTIASPARTVVVHVTAV